MSGDWSTVEADEMLVSIITEFGDKVVLVEDAECCEDLSSDDDSLYAASLLAPHFKSSSGETIIEDET